MIVNKDLTYKIISENQQRTENITLNVHSNPIDAMFVVHRAAITQLAERRLYNASTKTKSEVRGGGKKPWKQKGTGRARAGSNRSPLWKGGGVIFGPKNIKRYKKINKKEKQLAIKTLLVNKFKKTQVVDNLTEKLVKPSTKIIVNHLKNLGIELNKEKIVIIVSIKDKNLFLSTRNLKNVNLISADQINIISLLNAHKILITQSGLHKIAKLYQ